MDLLWLQLYEIIHTEVVVTKGNHHLTSYRQLLQLAAQLSRQVGDFLSKCTVQLRHSPSLISSHMQEWCHSQCYNSRCAMKAVLNYFNSRKWQLGFLVNFHEILHVQVTSPHNI